MTTQNPPIVIPICFMFNDAYLTPAKVAIFSMLKNANTAYNYAVHILYSKNSLSSKSIQELKKTAHKFRNAHIDFSEVDVNAFRIWDQTSQSHYAKDVYIKLYLSSIFTQYNTLICSDVDVVFTGDISKAFTDYDLSQHYIAGVRSLELIDDYINNGPYSPEIKNRLIGGIGGGFLVINLDAFRKNSLEKSFDLTLEKYHTVITQPEQDVLNLSIIREKILYLPLKFMFCTYMYRILIRKQLDLNCSGSWIRYYLLRLGLYPVIGDKYNTKTEIKEALYQPIQVHYATSKKPWNALFCHRKLLWYKYKLLDYLT
ncbi:MAG: glycosyltransferase family 8 protein [Candidatus Marinamargulisbacteria bacterium]